jgi:hypothetical protein
MKGAAACATPGVVRAGDWRTEARDPSRDSRQEQPMSHPTVIIEGTIKPDGTLELDGKVELPPGPAQVLITPWPELPQDDPFWQMMRSIWDAQKARGHVPRSAEEVEQERRRVRDEWDERMEAIERIQAEARQLRGQSS